MPLKPRSIISWRPCRANDHYTANVATPARKAAQLSVDKALQDAARDEFLTRGYLAMTMDGIAAGAGVSKVSLYRRWKSKDGAAADVLRLMSETRVPEDRGNLAAAIRALVEATIGSPEANAAARVLMRTMGEISDHPELLALYRTHLFGPRVEQIRTLVERARARGEIGDVATDIAAAVIAGPLFLHSLTLLAEPDRRWPENFTSELTRAILSGIAWKPAASEARGP